MSGTRRAWNEWDVPFFGAPVVTAHPTVPGAEAVLRFYDVGLRAADRVMAVLLAIGSIVGGFLVTGALLVASFVLSWLSSPSPGEKAFAVACGAAVALCGSALAFATYRHAGRPMGVTVHPDGLEVAYKTFKEPLRVSRDALRAVAIDDGSARRLSVGRFPIAGALPDDVFADALDNHPAAPWEDIDPERRERRVPWEFPRTSRGSSNGDDAHDDPDRPGWASKDSAIPPAPARQASLWSGDGSSLPFLRLRPGDIPNVALLFHEPHRAPRAPWWYDLSPVNSRWPSFRGGRPVRGLLLRVQHPDAVKAAFEPWGVVRPITAGDVLDEGLFVAKPLAGFRAVAYAGAVVVPMILRVVFRLIF